MFFMVGVVDRFEEEFVAGRPTDVFRRGPPLGQDQLGIQRAGLGLGDKVDPNGVLPAITEVIEIGDGASICFLKDFKQSLLGGVAKISAKVMIGNAPPDILIAEVVKVAVGPAEGNLQDNVEPIHTQVERYDQFAPDLRLDILEDDSDGGDEVRC